jgi:hypothetical protein
VTVGREGDLGQVRVVEHEAATIAEGGEGGADNAELEGVTGEKV